MMTGQYIYVDWKGKISIGNCSIINRNCILDRRGDIYIGKNVNISAEVAIYTGGHIINSPDFAYYSKNVYIDDYVFLHCNLLLLKMIRIL